MPLHGWQVPNHVRMLPGTTRQSPVHLFELPVRGMQVPDGVCLVPGDGSIAWRGDARYLATNTRAGPGTRVGTRSPSHNAASQELCMQLLLS